METTTDWGDHNNQLRGQQQLTEDTTTNWGHNKRPETTTTKYGHNNRLRWHQQPTEGTTITDCGHNNRQKGHNNEVWRAVFSIKKVLRMTLRIHRRSTNWPNSKRTAWESEDVVNGVGMIQHSVRLGGNVRFLLELRRATVTMNPRGEIGREHPGCRCLTLIDTRLILWRWMMFKFERWYWFWIRLRSKVNLTRLQTVSRMMRHFRIETTPVHYQLAIRVRWLNL